MRRSVVIAAIGIITLVLGSMIFSASAAPPKGPEISTKGYSIFDETIVDLAWPEVSAPIMVFF